MEVAPIAAGTTDPSLLARLGDWGDHEAWSNFLARYDPQLRRLCRRYGLRGDRADDACQQVWMKLAGRMRRFHYDPGLRFRGWLHRFFQRSLLDVLKSGGAAPAPEAAAIEALAGPAEPPGDDAGLEDPALSAMLRRAEQVQSAVRSRVKPENWSAFVLVAVEGRPVAEAAEMLARPYMSVYRAYQRVKAMIAEERLRRGPIPTGKP